MRVTCPHCRRNIEIIADEQAVSCPSCGSRLHVLEETVLQSRHDVNLISHFELLEHVGRGHFGDVWKARDVNLGRFVAVKKPRTRQLNDTTVNLFIREARAAARLRHNNIVSVHEVFTDHESVYIVSDFIDGITLAERMRVRRHEPREAAALCAALAEALDYAHTHGVEAHRDIKPGNIMIDASGQPYLMDFGLAKLDAADYTMTVAGQLLGTPSYMSPEQAQGAPTDRRTDVYSLGVVLYELLTQRRPFIGDTRLLIHQILTEEPPAPRSIDKSVPRDVQTICLKAMAKDPRHRYVTAAAFAEDLHRFLRGQPVLAQPVTLAERCWRWTRRNPRIAAPVGALAIALGLLSVVLIHQYRMWRGEFRDVALTTDPAGAKVAFIPMDDLRRPVPENIVQPSSVTPLKTSLRPGDYLVVAVLPSGDFHEVYRHVPHDPGDGRGLYHHNSWDAQSDGVIILPPITITPTAKAISNMAYFASATFPVGDDLIPGSPRGTDSVDDYYLDPTEVTNGMYRAVRGLPQDQEDAPDDEPVTRVNVDQALNYAELVGKRLVSEPEYEYAATHGGTRRFPWGDDIGLVTVEIFSRQPVMQPAFDHTDTEPPVYGLFSNVTEWTDAVLLQPAAGPLPDQLLAQLATSRVLRGGPISAEEQTAEPLAPALLHGPRRRAAENLSFQRAYIGFRCARSKRPRFVK